MNLDEFRATLATDHGSFQVTIAIAQLLVAKGILTNNEVADAIAERSESIIRGVPSDLVGDPGVEEIEQYVMSQIHHAKLIFSPFP